MKWREVQRLIGQYPEAWLAVGADIYGEAPTDTKNAIRPYLGCMTSPALARLVVMIHNTYLGLARETLMLRRRVEDKERMRER